MSIYNCIQTIIIIFKLKIVYRTRIILLFSFCFLHGFCFYLFFKSSAPEQQRLDDAIGYLRDHSEVTVSMVVLLMFIFNCEISSLIEYCCFFLFSLQNMIMNLC